MSRASVGLALGASAWLASGMLGGEPEAAIPRAQAELRLPLVETTRLRAQPVERFITGQGDVGAFRHTAERSQTAGRVAEILVDRGARVEDGAPLLRLTLEGLDSRLREAEAVLDRRQRDYDAQARLQQQGFSTAAQLRELETLLQSAREEVARLEEQIGDTVIRAPFAGVVDAIGVEPGEFVGAGTDVATIVDNVPLRTTVRVSQLDHAKIEAGGEVEVVYATGETERGLVCFVGVAADAATRTFPVEIRTPNASGTIPSGISAEVTIPTGAIAAHFVSPAILSLGTDGALVIKTADAEGLVGSHPVEVVRADAAGLWVSGLPEETDVITLGQGFVQEGDHVRVATDDPVAAMPSPRTRPAAGDLPVELCDRAPGVGSSVLSAATAPEGDGS